MHMNQKITTTTEYHVLLLWLTTEGVAQDFARTPIDASVENCSCISALRNAERVAPAHAVQVRARWQQQQLQLASSHSIRACVLCWRRFTVRRQTIPPSLSLSLLLLLDLHLLKYKRIY